SRRPYDARATASTVLRASSTESGLLEGGVKGDVNRADFDCAGSRRWAAGRPFEGCIERRDVENDETAELLLAFGKRAILNVTPAIPESNRGCGGDVLERRAAAVRPGRSKSLVVSPPSGDVRVSLGVLSGLEVLRSLEDQHHVFHRSSRRRS